jgi:hypothetical protein
MRNSWLIPGALALLLACDGTGPTTPPDGPVALSRLSPSGAAYETNSQGLTVPELGSVETQHSWDALYLRMKTNHIPMPTKGPDLRFRDSTVVYAGIGWFSNGRASVLLDSARIEDGALVVHYTRRVSEGCGVPAATIAPVDVAQVPRWEGPVRFVQFDTLVVCS